MIQVKGHPREVTQVLQKRKHREEDGHGGEHDRDDPEKGAGDAVHEKAGEEAGGVYIGQPIPHEGFQMAEAGAEQLGRVVGAGDGDPEDQQQQGEHNGDAETFAGEYFIQAAVEVVIGVLGADCFAVYISGQMDDGVDHDFADRTVRI